MALSYIKRKRNPFIISLIVGAVVFIAHLTISLLLNKANLMQSFIAGLLFFIIYFVFQVIQNFRLDRAKKKKEER